MPYITEKIAIDNPFLDRRTRLLPCQRERTLALREQDGLTYRAIASIMGVSKRIVYFVINPDKYALHQAKASVRQADGRYYDREKHNLAMRKHRKHKQLALLAERL